MNKFNLANNLKIGYRENKFIFSTNSMFFNSNTRKYFEQTIDYNFIYNDFTSTRSPENVVGTDSHFKTKDIEYFRTEIIMRLSS